MAQHLATRRHFHASLAQALLALSAACAATAAVAAPSQIVVFGDSLSDTGNVKAAFRTALNIQLPDAPYVNGRFSNGPVAVEVMAQRLNVPLTSLAYGGALTGTNNRITTAGVLTGTGTQSQITGYITAQNNSLDANALYVVWAGGNDFFSAPSAATVQTATNNLLNDVSLLYSAGARQFLVPNLPDLANTADSIKAGVAVQQAAHQITMGFNGVLAQTFAQAQTQLVGSKIEVFDTFGLLNTLRANDIAQGRVVDVGCWTGNFQNAKGTLCSQPENYFLWDNVHPTARIHQAVGEAFAQSNIALSAVPEPSTWLLACVGLVGLFGAAHRARRGPGHSA
jgi:phospholipase/lecithinase/hemolysin